MIQTQAHLDPQSQVGKYLTIQTGATQKMGKMTKLELNQLTYRTHNPILHRSHNPVLLLPVTQLL